MKRLKLILLFGIFLLSLLAFLYWLRSLETGETIKQRDERLITQRAQNSDVKAWLTVEGTRIDYPIVQHPSDDSYYLTHDINHHETYYGAIFIEGINSLDFNDVTTIVYGHAIQDGSMFGSLALFSEEAFFKRYRTITVMRNGETLEYEIMAAYPYTDDHLYHTFSLNTPNHVKRYVDQVEETSEAFGGFYRQVTFDVTKDKLLILSTCDVIDGHYRFIVHAIRKGEH